MGLEVATYIGGLVSTNPVGATDPKSQGDDHLRLIKSSLLATFPGLNTAPSADGQVLARVAGSLAWSADYPRLSQPNTFTDNVKLSHPTQLRVRFQEDDAPADEKLWHFIFSAGDMFFQSRTDADGPGASIMSVTRTGAVIDSVALTATAITLNGVNITDYARLSQSNPFTSTANAIDISGAGNGAYALRVVGQAGAAARSIAIFGHSGVSNGLTIDSDGTVITATLYGKLTFNTAAALVTGTISTPNTSASEVGFKGAPPNVQNGNYTLVLADAGCSINKQSGAGNTITVPANGSVAFPIGTIIAGDNDSGNSVSIAITTDTMELAGSGATGTRTVADNGSWTLTKIAATKWRISGSGVS